MGQNGPDALAVDGSGNVYVANALSGTVSEFPSGSTSVNGTLTGLSSPTALACDNKGDLVVANGNNTLSEFLAGVPGVTTVSTGLDSISGLAFDGSGNLYAANYDGNNVTEFALGTPHPAYPHRAGWTLRPGL